MVEFCWWPDSHVYSSQVSRLIRAELSFEDGKWPVNVKVQRHIRKLQDEGLDVSIGKNSCISGTKCKGNAQQV
jgi:hypothetical protein